MSQARQRLARQTVQSLGSCMRSPKGRSLKTTKNEQKRTTLFPGETLAHCRLLDVVSTSASTLLL